MAMNRMTNAVRPNMILNNPRSFFIIHSLLFCFVRFSYYLMTRPVLQAVRPAGMSVFPSYVFAGKQKGAAA